MNAIKQVYTVKLERPPDYYLGNNYKKDSKDRWRIGARRYIKESILRLEQDLKITILKRRVPLTLMNNPELDDSPLLDEKKHREYQMLIGTLKWIITIGCLDIGFATSSLERFAASPREGHHKRALKVFGYLK